MKTVLNRYWIMAAFACLAIGLPVKAQVTLPAGPGKPVVERMCKTCHTLDIVVKDKRTYNQWSTVVSSMVGLGAQGTDEEIRLVIEYLTEHFGVDNRSAAEIESTAMQGDKINVNLATAAELVKVLGLTEHDAEAIVAYRTKNGDLKEVLDFKKIPGIDLVKIADRFHLMAFEQADEAGDDGP